MFLSARHQIPAVRRCCVHPIIKVSNCRLIKALALDRFGCTSFPQIHKEDSWVHTRFVVKIRSQRLLVAQKSTQRTISNRTGDLPPTHQSEGVRRCDEQPRWDDRHADRSKKQSRSVKSVVLLTFLRYCGVVQWVTCMNMNNELGSCAGNSLVVVQSRSMTRSVFAFEFAAGRLSMLMIILATFLLPGLRA